MRSAFILYLGLSLAMLGCRDGGDSKTPLSAVVPNGSASSPAFARTPPAETAEPVAEPANANAPEEQPQADAEAPSDDAEPEKDAPLPDVTVKNVGMHIGGEANTADQKRPLRNAVAKHYDAMKRCYAKAEKTTKAVTFGVDMRIKGEGGNPKVSNPRSGLRGEGVKACLVTVFENIDFPRQPKGVARMVSFSVEFRKN
jgi:hypothetical protein